MDTLEIHNLASTKAIREIFIEQLKEGRTIQMNIKGNSMHPFIKRSDIVTVKPIKFEETRIGDIIAYTRSVEHDFTAHRLIRKRRDAQGREFLFTKGDASMHGDLPVYPGDVYGKAVIIERNAKVINLETKFNRLSSYLIAYLSWGLALFKLMIVCPKTSHCSNKKLKVRQIEDEYLIQSIAAATSGKKFSKFKGGFGWDYLLNTARKNRVSSFLYFYQKEEKEGFPKNFFKELEKDYYYTSANNTFIWEKIKPILRSLEEKNIRVILLKGIALGASIYPSVGLRPMSDVDILIKDEDIFKVDEILNSFGYFSANINPRDIELGKTEYLTTLWYAGKNLSLHLHRHLINSTVPSFSYISKINMERIWQKAKLMEMFGVKALVLSPEYLIIYLCEHSLKVTHSLSRLIFLADISQAINYYQDKIDWDFLVKESSNFGLERMVYCGLYCVNRILRTELPSGILSTLKPKRLSLGEKISLSLIAKNRSFPGLSHFIHLAMNKGLLEKARFILRTLFPPRHVLAQRYCIPESKWSYFYYLYRIREVFSSGYKGIRFLMGRSS